MFVSKAMRVQKADQTVLSSIFIAHTLTQTSVFCQLACDRLKIDQQFYQRGLCAMAEIVLLYVTTIDEEEAARIGKALVEERLCACANIIPGVRSLYQFEGTLCDEREVVLIAKTTASLTDACVARITGLHSYDLACVVSLPVSGGNVPFLEWVQDETKTKTKTGPR
jgi:periplasmic divalent cation tolerance protein